MTKKVFVNLVSLLLCVAASAAGQAVVIDSSELIKRDTKIEDCWLLDTGADFALVWIEEGDVFLKRLSYDFVPLRDEVQVIDDTLKLKGATGAAWGGGSVFLAYFDMVTNEQAWLSIFDLSGQLLETISMGLEAGGAHVSSPLITPLGCSIARFSGPPISLAQGGNTLRLDTYDFGGDTLATRSWTHEQLPEGRLNILPYGDGFLLSLWVQPQFLELSLLAAVIRPGLEFPSLSLIVTTGDSTVFGGPDRFLVVYISSDRLAARAMDRDFEWVSRRVMISGRPIDAANEGFRWPVVDVAYTGGEFGCAWIRGPLTSPSMKFRRITKDGRPVGDKLSLRRGHELCSPRVVFADGHYFVYWIEKTPSPQIYGCKISP